MKQAFYSLIDFLEDSDFVSWVKYPDDVKDTYWRHFLEQYPAKKPVVEAARQYVLALVEQTGQQLPTEAQSQSMREVIQQHLQDDRRAIPFVKKSRNNWRWLQIAATVTLVVGLGIGGYWYTNQEKPSVGYQHFTKSASPKTALSVARNDDDKPLTISLSDGSSVVLQPGSRLSYPNKLKQREVYLEGKAFFEVVKDPSRPFIVYTRGVATKVLGTSFFVNAPASDQPIKVAVKTGKVAVYSLDQDESKAPEPTGPELTGMVLTPNQSAEYRTDSHELVRGTDTLSTFAEPGTLTVARQSFDFDETPIPDVFQTLEKAYGVDIVYKEPILGKCSLSATLIGQPFHEKLSVICKALEANYSIQGNQVFITGGHRCQ